VRLQLPTSYGNELARCFYVSEAPSLLVKPLSRSQLAVTRVTSRNGLAALSASVRAEKAFTIAVHLIDPDFRRWGTWIDGRFVKVKSRAAGKIGIFDLESDPRAVRDTAFDCVHYNLPRTTLDAFTEDAELPKVDTFHCEQGTGDPAIHHLTLMLLLHLEAPHAALSRTYRGTVGTAPARWRMQCARSRESRDAGQLDASCRGKAEL